MVTNVSIHDSVKIIITMFLTFIQMRADEYKLWQTRKASWNGCGRRDFEKWLCKKILHIVMNSVILDSGKNFFDLPKVNKITTKFLTCSKSVSNHLRSSHLKSSYLRNSHPRSCLTCSESAKPTFRLVQSRQK